MATKAEEQRLDRIEQKIDKLAECMVALARAEEKLTNLEGDTKLLNDRLNSQSQKIDVVEVKIDETQVTVRVINRIFWIFVSTVMAAAAADYFNLINAI